MPPPTDSNRPPLMGPLPPAPHRTLRPAHTANGPIISNRVPRNPILERMFTVDSSRIQARHLESLMTTTVCSLNEARAKVRNAHAYLKFLEVCWASSFSHPPKLNAFISIIILIASVLPTSFASSHQHARFFQGYDCSNPHNVQAIGFSDMSCQDIRGTPVARNVTYQLLQKQDYISHPAVVCYQLISRRVQYCGNYDHQTILPQAEFSNVRRAVPIRKCKQALNEGIWTDPHDMAHMVANKGNSRIIYHEVGKTYLTKDKEVKCDGGSWTFNGFQYENMVVTIEIQLSVHEEELSIGEREVIARDLNVRLPCSPDNRECELADSTVIWNKIEDPCPLARLRITSGAVVSTLKQSIDSPETDGEAYMSQDGSMVRLLLQGAITICGVTVIKTNFPDLFLHELESPTETKFATIDSVFRDIEATEISMARYVQNRDSFLAASFNTLLRPELEHMQHVQCKSYLEDRRAKFYLQHKMPGLYTWEIGNGTFGTSAGEVFYVYQCAKVIVEAVELEKCYGALPVKFANSERTLVRNQKKIFYLEPLTHRLLTSAETVVCSTVFSPKYRNIGGGWTTANPTVQATTAPSLSFSFDSIMNEEIRLLQELNTDDPNAGIYTDASLQEMEKLMNYQRTKEALVGTLITQGSIVHSIDQGHIAPQDLFPELPDFSLNLWNQHLQLCIRRRHSI